MIFMFVCFVNVVLFKFNLFVVVCIIVFGGYGLLFGKSIMVVGFLLLLFFVVDGNVFVIVYVCFVVMFD